jgi:hypothetical protein
MAWVNRSPDKAGLAGISDAPRFRISLVLASPGTTGESVPAQFLRAVFGIEAQSGLPFRFVRAVAGEAAAGKGGEDVAGRSPRRVRS